MVEQDHGDLLAAIEMETEQSVSPESRMRPQPASAGVVTADTSSKQRCAVIDCENTTGNGRFVGDFCAPCETALRIGNFDHGTSIPFKLSAEVVRQRIEIERLRTALKDARTALVAVAYHSRQPLMAADARAAMVKIGHALGGISDETSQAHE